MLRWVLLGLLALIVAAVSAVRATPLEYAMTQAGLPNTIVNWSSAQGTVMSGRLNTVSIGPQLVGDIQLKQRFVNPLSRSITYDVQWGSVGGRGAGQIMASAKRVKVSNLRAQQNVVAMPGLIPAIRELGGSIRILNGYIDVDHTGCKYAEGIVTTDVLIRLGRQYGRSFADLQGPLSCDDGVVLIKLNASSDEGDTIDIAGKVGTDGAGEFNIVIESEDPEIRLVLQEYGFEKSDGNVWRYRYQT